MDIGLFILEMQGQIWVFTFSKYFSLKCSFEPCFWFHEFFFPKKYRTLKANCIRVRPQWMYEDRHIVGDIPLHALMIPGTHNSGAYDVNFGVSILTYLLSTMGN